MIYYDVRSTCYLKLKILHYKSDMKGFFAILRYSLNHVQFGKQTILMLLTQNEIYSLLGTIYQKGKRKKIFSWIHIHAEMPQLLKECLGSIKFYVHLAN